MVLPLVPLRLLQLVQLPMVPNDLISLRDERKKKAKFKVKPEVYCTYSLVYTYYI